MFSHNKSILVSQEQEQEQEQEQAQEQEQEQPIHNNPHISTFLLYVDDSHLMQLRVDSSI